MEWGSFLVGCCAGALVMLIIFLLSTTCIFMSIRK